MFSLVDKSKISRDDIVLCQDIFSDLAHIFNENVILKNQKQLIYQLLRRLKRIEFTTWLDKQNDLKSNYKTIEKYERKQKSIKT